MKLKSMMMIGTAVVGIISLFGCAEVPRDKKDKYAIITKAGRNSYNDQIEEGFLEVIEQDGSQCIIKQPEKATAEAQMVKIQEAINEEVQGLAVAATDADALEELLNEAKEQGIKVVTFDSNANENSRMTFINQASAEAIGKVLMEAVYDISGGSGQWAILSTTSQAVNQNEWIDAMRKEAGNRKYKDLRLVDIVYGEDEFEESWDCTKKLLEDYPELKVICAPTVMGIHAAAQIVSQDERAKDVKVTGLGLPVEMEKYIGSGIEYPCPYIYLWNPREVGRLTAYTAIELVKGEVKGFVGESFKAGDMGTYKFEPCSMGGSELIVGEPLEINHDNIEERKELF